VGGAALVGLAPLPAAKAAVDGSLAESGLKPDSLATRMERPPASVRGQPSRWCGGGSMVVPHDSPPMEVLEYESLNARSRHA